MPIEAENTTYTNTLGKLQVPCKSTNITNASNTRLKVVQRKDNEPKRRELLMYTQLWRVCFLCAYICYSSASDVHTFVTRAFLVYTHLEFMHRTQGADSRLWRQLPEFDSRCIPWIFIFKWKMQWSIRWNEILKEWTLKESWGKMTVEKKPVSPWSSGCVAFSDKGENLWWPLCTLRTLKNPRQLK